MLDPVCYGVGDLGCSLQYESCLVLLAWSGGGGFTVNLLPRLGVKEPVLGLSAWEGPVSVSHMGILGKDERGNGRNVLLCITTAAYPWMVRLRCPKRQKRQPAMRNRYDAALGNCCVDIPRLCFRVIKAAKLEPSNDDAVVSFSSFGLQAGQSGCGVVQTRAPQEGTLETRWTRMDGGFDGTYRMRCDVKEENVHRDYESEERQVERQRWRREERCVKCKSKRGRQI
ncbi:hypothetical protein ACQKWADRAFT_301285 [Trichoderma austrokoningii]